MTRFSLLICLLVGNFAFSSIVTKTNPRLYSITIRTDVEHFGPGVSETDLFLAYFKHNNYQFALNRKVDQHGQYLLFGAAGDSCIHYNLKLGANAGLRTKIQLFSSYNLVVYDVSTDFSAIDSLYPYEKDLTYKFYTKSNLPYIDINNKTLIPVADSIWNVNPNYLDYAEASYEYVAENFEYRDKESGFRSLNKILKLKGSDCGNLSSVWITLLRMKGIPARHLMGFRPDGSLHVWAEFYLENWGWIPVDVTYANVDFDGNYFGNIMFRHNGFIVHRGIGNIVEYNNIKRRISGLQTYSYESRFSNEDKAKIKIDRKVFCKKLERWNPMEIAGFASN